MRIFEYIFFRSFIYFTKRKKTVESATSSGIYNASIAEIFLLGSIIIIANTIFYIYDYQPISKKALLIFAVPFGLGLWYLNEMYFKKKSNNNYEELQRKFSKSRWNKIPFWILIALPLIQIFIVTYIIHFLR